MTFGKTYSMKRRVAKALWALFLNAILWIAVPYYIGGFLGRLVPNTPLAIPAFVYEFGALFIILDVGAAFFDGMAISIPFLSGAALLSAYYLWLVTSGGNMAFSAQGMSVALDFQILVYLLIVPSVWGAIRAPLSYMVHRRAQKDQIVGPSLTDLP
jgi:hypothetical protein